MAIQDPVTGALQTPEQVAASESQQREGLFARLEGWRLKFQEQFSALGTRLDEQTKRVDAIEQKAKGAETLSVGKVAEHIAAREGNLVIVTTEHAARLERLEKVLVDLVAKINGQAPDFFTLPPMPAPPAKTVPEKVPAPPAVPMKTPAQLEAERQARMRAAQAEADRKAREGGGA